MSNFKTAGFTLVESLVAITVTTTMVLVIAGFTLQNLRQSALANQRSQLLGETQLTLDRAANDVRLSANSDLNNRWPDAHAPSGAGSPYSWQSNGSTLILAAGAQDKNGNIIFADAKNYITEKNNLIYFVKNGTLYKRTLASTIANNAARTTCPAASATSACPADKELLHNVTQFSLTYLDGDNQSVIPTNAHSVELRVVTNKKVYSKLVSADYTTRMVFRND